MFLILCGKSGAGKDAIAKRLCRRGFKPIVSCTSRPMREGEVAGRDYHFLSNSTFKQFIEDGVFIEYRSYDTLVDGKPDTWYYGTTKQELPSCNKRDPERKDYVIVLDLDGAKAFMDFYGRENCLCCFIDASKADRTERAMKRGSFDQTEWERRLGADDEDFSDDKCEEICDLCIHNGNMDYISSAVGKIVMWFEHKFYD